MPPQVPNRFVVAGAFATEALRLYRERKIRAGSSVHLVREFDNKYDNNAVAIYVGTEKVGYVPKNINEKIDYFHTKTQEWKILSVKKSGYENVAIAVYRPSGFQKGQKIKKQVTDLLKDREEFRDTKKLHLIYGIYVDGFGRAYVGSTTQGLEKRKKQHLELLRASSHHNVRLQNLFLEFGEDAFEFRGIRSVRNRVDLRVQEGIVGKQKILIHPSDIKRR